MPRCCCRRGARCIIKRQIITRAGPPNQIALEGYWVIDFGQYNAGPAAAMMLADQGAEVIKIDSPQPMLDPCKAIVFGMQANRSKRNLLLNLKNDEGQGILSELMRDTDVVTSNANDPQLERLGLSAEKLGQISPNATCASSTPLAARFLDGVVNIRGTTIWHRQRPASWPVFGGGIETPGEHAHFGTIDVLGGFCAALAIGMALVKRADGGGASVARSSLAAAGQLIQAPFMFDYDGRAPFQRAQRERHEGRTARSGGRRQRIFREARAAPTANVLQASIRLGY